MHYSQPRYFYERASRQCKAAFGVIRMRHSQSLASSQDDGRLYFLIGIEWEMETRLLVSRGISQTTGQTDELGGLSTISFLSEPLFSFRKQRTVLPSQSPGCLAVQLFSVVQIERFASISWWYRVPRNMSTDLNSYGRFLKLWIIGREQWKFVSFCFCLTTKFKIFNFSVSSRSAIKTPLLTHIFLILFCL
jgi:hypothetical protein